MQSYRVVLLIGAIFLLTLFCSVFHVVLVREPSPAGRRAGFGLGLVALASLLGLAAIWPSIHTLLALPALPAILVFGAGLLAPGLAGRAWVRWYGLAAVSLAALAWGVQLVWMVWHSLS